MTASVEPQTDCDVFVVGSGAGGLAAAVVAAHHGLKVVVAEKAPVFGGTSAWSGGWLWIPRNPLARRGGFDEDESAPRAYLASELGNRVSDPRLDVFLRNGPEMVAFFEDETALEFIDGDSVPDFHETPGWAKGGRSVSAKSFDGRRLGRWIEKLRPPLDVISLGGMGIASGGDLGHFFNATRSLRSAAHVARRLARHARDLALHKRGMHLVNGNALVARLLRSALDLGVTLIDSAPAQRLILEAGRVGGAVIERSGGEVSVRARRGVVLAAGGFPHDRRRIARMFEHAPDGTGHHSAAPETNTGAGLALAETAGGVVADDLASPGAWAPVSLVPLPDGRTARFPHLVDRAKPGFLAVGPDGRRFVNEAESYHDFMTALFEAAPAGRPPHAWLICDHRAQRRFGLGWAKPFPFPVERYVRLGYLRRGRSLQALAEACGLPADALEATVNRFNAAALRGEDPEFGRGASAYNRMQGDPGYGPNPSLGPLDKAPFYAVKLVPGSLATFAGLRTDARARVLSGGGAPIDGLFAVGADMASIMGGHYPSGGINLGPAMTFGYIAARTLAGLPISGLDDATALQAEETPDDVLRARNA